VESKRTFFVTTSTEARDPIFRHENAARLFLAVLHEYRNKGHFLLHEFVIMPDHVHLLLTPKETLSLERAIQYIKGGFSFRYGKEINQKREVWQKSFINHRIHNAEDYERHRTYIHQNPVSAKLVDKAELYPYSSAFPGFDLDPAPEDLRG
jgi:putative transposase